MIEVNEFLYQIIESTSAKVGGKLSILRSV